MEAALRAIAHPVRRRMLRLVWDAERSAGELAEQSDVSAPTASKHLRVLRDAGLVTVRVEANRRLYQADPERISELRSFLEAFWEDRLDRLGETAVRRARI